MCPKISRLLAFMTLGGANPWLDSAASVCNIVSAMHTIRRFLLWQGLILACAGFRADGEAVSPAPPLFMGPLGNRVVATTLLWENDSFVDTDQQYTNGTRLELTLGATVDREKLFPPLAPFVNLLEDGQEVFGTLFIGQDLYTPSDISIPYLMVNDRPYAAWLYGGARFATRKNRDDVNERLPWVKQAADYASIELSGGVVGPWAQGNEIQTWFHDLIHYQRPKGWANQIPNEVVVDASYYRSLSLRLIGDEHKVFSFDVDPFFNANLGTVYVHGGAGIAAVAGLNHKLGATPRRESYSAPLTRTQTDRSWEAAFFGSIEERAVAWNSFLDGPMFDDNPDTHTVDKKNLLWHSEIGLLLRYRCLVASYIYVIRSAEFRGQDGNHPYGSARIGLEFPF